MQEIPFFWQIIVIIITICGVAAAVGTLVLRMSIRLEERINERMDRIEKQVNKLDPHIRRARTQSQKNLVRLAYIEGALDIVEHKGLKQVRREKSKQRGKDLKSKAKKTKVKKKQLEKPSEPSANSNSEMLP